MMFGHLDVISSELLVVQHCKRIIVWECTAVFVAAKMQGPVTATSEAKSQTLSTIYRPISVLTSETIFWRTI